MYISSSVINMVLTCSAALCAHGWSISIICRFWNAFAKVEYRLQWKVSGLFMLGREERRYLAACERAMEEKGSQASQVNRVSFSRKTSCTTSAPQLLSKDGSSSKLYYPQKAAPYFSFFCPDISNDPIQPQWHFQMENHVSWSAQSPTNCLSVVQWGRYSGWNS